LGDAHELIAVGSVFEAVNGAACELNLQAMVGEVVAKPGSGVGGSVRLSDERSPPDSLSSHAAPAAIGNEDEHFAASLQ
jgi:hypothetical protein